MINIVGTPYCVLVRKKEKLLLIDSVTLPSIYKTYFKNMFKQCILIMFFSSLTPLRFSLSLSTHPTMFFVSLKKEEQKKPKTKTD